VREELQTFKICERSELSGKNYQLTSGASEGKNAEKIRFLKIHPQEKPV
jgi:hypothetical protein